MLTYLDVRKALKTIVEENSLTFPVPDLHEFGKALRANPTDPDLIRSLLALRNFFDYRISCLAEQIYGKQIVGRNKKQAKKRAAKALDEKAKESEASEQDNDSDESTDDSSNVEHPVNSSGVRDVCFLHCHRKTKMFRFEVPMNSPNVEVLKAIVTKDSLVELEKWV